MEPSRGTRLFDQEVSTVVAATSSARSTLVEDTFYQIGAIWGNKSPVGPATRRVFKNASRERVLATQQLPAIMTDRNDATAQAVLAADLDRLQYVLLKVLENEHGRSLVEDELLVTATDSENDIKSPEEPGAAAVAASNKRKRFEYCVQCKKEFEVTKNGPEACVWHEGIIYLESTKGGVLHVFVANASRQKGEMEPDYDSGFWADNDEDCHGPVDSKENREDYPEGFIWDCCEEKGNESTGCETGFHLVGEPPKKRSRMCMC